MELGLFRLAWLWSSWTY